MITSMLVRKFFAKSKPVIMPQPPYSPCLAPADFLLLPKLKTTTKAMRFTMIEEIKEKSKHELLAIPNSVFQKYFKDWIKRWHKCIISEEGYYEGDKIVIDK